MGLSKEALEGKTIYEAWSDDIAQVIEPHYVSALVGETTVSEVLLGDKSTSNSPCPCAIAKGRSSPAWS